MKLKLSFLLLFSSFLFANVQVNESVIATGYGVSKDKALQNAFKDAVRQSVGIVIDSETMLKNDDVIKDEILTALNGYIKKYDILSEEKEDGLFVVKIKADVASQSIQEKVKSLNIATHKVSIDGDALKNQIAQKQTKELSEAEKSELAQKYLKDFITTSKKEVLNFMQLKVDKVDIDIANFKDGELPYEVEYTIDYNYDLYLKMVTELEEKFANLGLKVKKRAAIIESLENQKLNSISHNIEKTYTKDHIKNSKGTQIAIIKKFAGKYSVDIWDLPFELRSTSPSLYDTRIYYEVLNKNEVLDFGYKDFGQKNHSNGYYYGNSRFNFHNSWNIILIPAYISAYGDLFYAKIFNSIKDTIKDSANLSDVDISKLTDLEIKLTLEEK